MKIGWKTILKRAVKKAKLEVTFYDSIQMVCLGNKKTTCEFHVYAPGNRPRQMLTAGWYAKNGKRIAYQFHIPEQTEVFIKTVKVILSGK